MIEKKIKHIYKKKMASCILSCLKFFQQLKINALSGRKAPSEVGALDQ